MQLSTIFNILLLFFFTAHFYTWWITEKHQNIQLQKRGWGLVGPWWTTNSRLDNNYTRTIQLQQWNKNVTRPFSVVRGDDDTSYRDLMERAFKNHKKHARITDKEHSNCFVVNNPKIKTICLPIYFIIGVSKSGTSSLHYYLTEDRRFVARESKETWHTHVPFAGPNISGSLQRYLSSFRYRGAFSCPDNKGKALKACTYTPSPTEQSATSQIIAVHKRENISVPDSITRLAALSRHKKGVGVDGSTFLTADATPDYHFYADVPQGLHELFPRAKVVLLVRDELQRAVSTFRFAGLGMQEDSLKEHRDFGLFLRVLREHEREMNECLAALGNISAQLPETNQHWTIHNSRDFRKKETINKVLSKHPVEHPVHKQYIELRSKVSEVSNPCHFQPFLGNHNNILGRSMVSSHLQWWLQFVKKEDFLVIDYDAFIASPRQVTKETMKFLGLHGDDFPDAESLFIVTMRGPLSAGVISGLENLIKKENQLGLGSPYAAWNRTLSVYKETLLTLRRKTMLRTVDKRGVGARLLQDNNMMFFDPRTVTVEAVDEISRLLRNYSYAVELDKIAAMGVYMLR